MFSVLIVFRAFLEMLRFFRCCVSCVVGAFYVFCVFACLRCFAFSRFCVFVCSAFLSF